MKVLRSHWEADRMYQFWCTRRVAPSRCATPTRRKRSCALWRPWEAGQGAGDEGPPLKSRWRGTAAALTWWGKRVLRHFQKAQMNLLCGGLRAGLQFICKLYRKWQLEVMKIQVFSTILFWRLWGAAAARAWGGAAFFGIVCFLKDCHKWWDLDAWQDGHAQRCWPCLIAWVSHLALKRLATKKFWVSLRSPGNASPLKFLSSLALWMLYQLELWRQLRCPKFLFSCQVFAYHRSLVVCRYSSFIKAVNKLGTMFSIRFMGHR